MTLIEKMARAYMDDDRRDADIWGRVECGIRAALAAASDAGWQLVPMKPTEAMSESGTAAYHAEEALLTADAVDAAYRAMLEKAPKP